MEENQNKQMRKRNEREQKKKIENGAQIWNASDDFSVSPNSKQCAPLKTTALTHTHTHPLYTPNHLHVATHWHTPKPTLKESAARSNQVTHSASEPLASHTLTHPVTHPGPHSIAPDLPYRGATHPVTHPATHPATYLISGATSDSLSHTHTHTHTLTHSITHPRYADVGQQLQSTDTNVKHSEMMISN